MDPASFPALEKMEGVGEAVLRARTDIQDCATQPHMRESEFFNIDSSNTE